MCQNDAIFWNIDFEVAEYVGKDGEHSYTALFSLDVYILKRAIGC